jgi:serine/threonine protein kinase
MIFTSEDGEEPDTLPKQGPTRDHRTGMTVGNYVLQERLGQGGMASVYRAVHKNFGELVAVKLLDARFIAEADMLPRFLHEARVMREISAKNQHIPRALDFGETAVGEPYLIMEHLTGQDLAELVRTVGPLEWSRLAPLALQLCDALIAVHSEHIIHRDIKPSNCFLAHDGGKQVAKLIDFGIAKDLNAQGEQTASNVVLGTPSYLAPELLTGVDHPNPRTDIYSFGATLYCLLTGRPPYKGRAQDIVLERQRTRRLVPPSAERAAELPRLPRAVDELVMRALSIDPSRRFQSVDELAEAIVCSCEAVPHTSQLDGGSLGLRVVWGVALAAGLAAALTTELSPTAAASWVPRGVPLASSVRAPEAVPPSDAAPAVALDADEPVTPPTPQPDAVATTDAPAVPEPADGPRSPSAVKSTEAAPAKPAAPEAKSTQAEPAKPMPPETTARPSDPRRQKVLRVLADKLDALRGECLPLAGGNRGLFIVTLDAAGVFEAVQAEPGPFRECVRHQLRGVVFGVSGRYEYRFKAK